MLKNCKLIIKRNDYKITRKETENENNSLGYKDYDIKTIQIFQAILNNDIKDLTSTIKDNLQYIDNKIILSKKALRTELKIKNAPNLKRDVFNKSNVKQFCKENQIIIETKRIILQPKRGLRNR